MVSDDVRVVDSDVVEGVEIKLGTVEAWVVSPESVVS